MLCKTRTTQGTYFGPQGAVYQSTNIGGGAYTFCKNWDLCNLLAIENAHKLGPSRADRSINYLDPALREESFCSTNRGKYAINNCTHQRTRHEILPFTAVVSHIRYRDRQIWYPYYMLSTTGGWVDPVLQHPQIFLEDARRQAWHEMQPEFVGKVSLINFIYELKDFKEIAKHLAKPMASIQMLKKSLKRHWRRVRKGDRSIDLSRPAAELHLANEFAIKPLISDLMELHILIKLKVEDLQKSFIQEGTIENTRYYTEDFVHSSSVGFPYKYYYYATGTHYRTKFVAGMRYTYGYKVRHTLDAITQYYGLKLSAEAVWNMLPFSFLLDYVLPVGDSIARMSHDSHLSLQLGTYWESLLTERTTGIHLMPSYNCASPVMIDNSVRTETSLISGMRSVYYTREVRPPNKGASLPRLKKPSDNQQRNLAALIRVLF